MVDVPPGNDLAQPFPLAGDWLVASASHFFLHCREPHLQAVASGLPPEQEAAPPRLAADEREAQEVEGFRLTQPALRASGRCMATNSIRRVFSGCNASANSSRRARISSRNR